MVDRIRQTNGTRAGGIGLLLLAGRMVSRTIAIAASVSVAVVPAMAQVVADGATATSVASGGAGVTNVTTATVTNGTGYNTFNQFDVAAGTTVNVVEPTDASALVNIIRGGQSNISGTVNALKGSAAGPVGGNVFFVNADGFMISASGVINAGNLTLSAPNRDFVDNLAAEATGGIGGSTAALFAGTENLVGGGDITVEGAINASRLDMRAGARMMISGQITVDAPDATGRIQPAVNAEGRPSAGGVSIGSDGVVRLFAKGDVDLSPTVAAPAPKITASRGDSGGLVEVIAEGVLTIDADFDVSGMNAGQGGAVTLFAEGNAAISDATVIDASSVAGDAGFFALTSKAGDVTVGQVAFKTAETVIEGEGVTVTGAVTTDGGSIALVADDAARIAAGASIDTRVRTGAGDIVIVGETISVEAGAGLQAQNSAASGLVALTARAVTEGVAWNFIPEENVASVTIDSATIRGGTVIVTALATASNTLGSDDAATEAAQVASMEDGVAAFEAEFANTIDRIEGLITDGFERGLQTVSDLLPVQVQILRADARVTITNSVVNADGRWTPAAVTTADATVDGSVDGVFSSTALGAGTTPMGLRIDGYALFSGGALGVKVSLPAVFDTASETMLVASHALTQFAIAPKAYGLGVAVANANTTSRTTITGGSLVNTGGGTRLLSTAYEDHALTLNASKIANGSNAVGVVVRSLENQLRVSGGTVSTTGNLMSEALTGKRHSLSVGANGGTNGVEAVAINVSVGQGLTEAALGGTITVGGDLGLRAETLYFDKSFATTAALGAANVLTTLRNKVIAGAARSRGLTAIADKVQGKPADPNRKPHFGIGAAIGVEVDNDNTFASLGGSYRNLDDPARALIDLGTTTVTAGNVDVVANLRWADRLTEGGGSLSKSASAAMGKINFVAKKQLAIYNAANDPDITEDELLGRFDNAIMLSVGVGVMNGETMAEIGGNATINAATLDVNALTRYPNTNALANIKTAWSDFATAVSDYELLPDGFDPANPGATQPTPPPLNEMMILVDQVNPLTYITTEGKAKAKASTPSDGSRDGIDVEDQKLAFGVTTDVLVLDNTTVATIRDGASLTLSATANITALQQSLMLHIVNLPKGNPLGGDVNDSIGVGISVATMASTVRAEIEDGATVTLTNRSDLNVTAGQRNIRGMLAFSGGQGKNTGLNASVAALVSQADTLARIGENARILAGVVAVAAEDKSVSWSTAGAVSASENIGFGGSGAITFTSRKVRAGVMGVDGAVGYGATDTDVVIDATSLAVTALNDTLDVTVTVAGSKVNEGKPDAAPDDQGQQDQDDKIIPDWLFADEEEDALNAQNNVETPAAEDGSKQKSGWAVAAAASVNLVLANETSATIATAGRIELTDDLTVTATSKQLGVTVAGAISAALGKTQSANALAGAFGVHVDTRALSATLRDATVVAGGAVTVAGIDQATVVNVAVGGAGTSKGKIALAGSVAVAVLDGGTDALIADSDVTSASLDLSATDTSTTVNVGGAVGINMSANEGAGVGVGVAVAVIDRAAQAMVAGVSAFDTGAFSVTATSTQRIYGFGISAGVGKTGLAGSVVVNTITGGAKALVAGTSTARMDLKAESVVVAATETNSIFALSGALAGGRQNAIGAAVGVNVITAATEAKLAYADVTNASLGTVDLTATGTSTITSIVVAGGATPNQTAVGAGIGVNVITAGVTANATGLAVTDATRFAATATGGREIFAIGGGAAIGGAGAGGAALVVNVLAANDTRVLLDDANISTREGGAITATMTAADVIRSLAVAISASKGTSVSGGIAVNVLTGNNALSAKGAILASDAGVTLAANSGGTIESLSGGAAVSLGGTGVGAAVSANFIDRTSDVIFDNAVLTTNNSALSITSNSTTGIKALAVGLAVSTGSTAVSGSIAIGDIGNTVRAAGAGAQLLDSGAGSKTISATKTDTIEILSGAVSASGSNAIGGAITSATINGGAEARLTGLAGLTGTGDLTVNASKSGVIDAIAVSGSGSGATSIAGSFVFTMIGKPGANAARSQEVQGDTGGSPVADAEADTIAERDKAVADLNTALANNVGSRTTLLSTQSPTLTKDDVTVAELSENLTDGQLGATSVIATDGARIRSLAGGVAGGGTAGIGAGISVNLLFQQTLASMSVTGANTITAANGTSGLRIAATQTGSVETAGISGGVGGTAGAAGSIVVNVSDRSTVAELRGTTTQATRANRGMNSIAVEGTDVGIDVTATQTGTFKALAGAVGIGGTAGGGGAVVVNVMSDDARASLSDVAVSSSDPADAGNVVNGGLVQVAATQTLTLEALAAAAAGGSTGALAGSFAINVIDGGVTAEVLRSRIAAGSIAINAWATNTLRANSGSVAADGGASIGLAVASNTTAQKVLADIASSTLQSAGSLTVGAQALTGLGGNAISGAFSGGVGVTGTGVGNVARNDVQTRIRAAGAAEASDLLALGTVVLQSRATNTISLLGGAKEKPTDSDSGPGLNLSLSGGGAAGVGVSVTVNLIENIVRTEVIDGSVATGLGNGAAVTTLSGLSGRGTIAEATGSTSMSMAAANGSAGGVAGISALVVVNLLKDSARVVIGSGTRETGGALGSYFDGDTAPALGGATGVAFAASSAQDTILNAKIVNAVESYAVAIGVGGSAGVGAALATNVVGSTSEVLVNTGQIEAKRDVGIYAETQTTMENWVIGAGGGFVGAAGSVGVSILRGDALVTLRMAQVLANRNVVIDSYAKNDVTSYVGAASAGVAALGGAVNVTSLTGRSVVSMERQTALAAPVDDTTTVGIDEDRDSLIDAQGTVTVTARTTTDVGTAAAAGSAGGGAVAVGANVTLNDATTQIVLDADQRISGVGDVALSANETVNIDGLGGAIAAGTGFGVGAGLDYARLSGLTAVTIGDRSQVNSQSGAVSLTANSARTIDSIVGVGALGGVAGVAAAVGIVEAGGTATTSDSEVNDDNTQVRADAQSGLAGSADEGDGTEAGASADDKRNTANAMAGYAGGTDTDMEVRTERRALNVTASAQPDAVTVSLGQDASIFAGGAVNLTATAGNSITQNGGAVAVGGLAGVVSGTLVTNIGTAARTTLGNRSRIEAGTDVTLRATTGGVGGAAALDANAVTVAASGSVAAGVGVAVANLSSAAEVTLGEGVSITGPAARNLNSLTLEAARSEVLDVRVDNVAVGVVGGIGTAVTRASNTGVSAVKTATGGTLAVLRATTARITASDASRMLATSVGSAGGILAGANGSDAEARNSGRTELLLDRVDLQGTTLTLANLSTAEARAKATGVAVAGGLAVGVSLATARVDSTLTTRLGGRTEGQIVDIRTELSGVRAGQTDPSRNAYAEAKSTSGGILSGNGANAKAWLAYTISTDVTGSLRGTSGTSSRITLGSDANTATAESFASGKVFGGVAIGATLSSAGQEAGKVASVRTTFTDATVTGQNVSLRATNDPTVRTTAESGSGGLVAGSGAEVDQRINAKTALTFAGTTTLAARNLSIAARQTGRTSSSLDTLSAALVGVSGAKAKSTLIADTDVTLGGGTVVLADALDIAAVTRFERPQLAANDGFNVVSGSGGALDVAAIVSTVTVDANTDVTIAGGARLTQTAAREAGALFRIGAASDMELKDRLNLDSGGAIAIPIGNSTVNVRTNGVKVTIGGAEVRATGLLQLYAGAEADMRSEVDTSTYGLAGAGTANSRALFASDTQILLNSGTLLESLGDVEMLAGYTANGAQAIKLRAESRVFNKTAIPIPTVPVADATANTISGVFVADGAKVLAVRDVTLFAEEGGRDIVGYGRGKDLYREVLGAIASAVSNAFGGDDVSLDIESGESVSLSNDLITVDGIVRAGSRNKQVLILDANNEIDNSIAGDFPGGPFTNADAEGITYRVLLNQSVSSDLRNRIDELTGFLTNTTLNQDAKAVTAWTAERDQLNARLALEPGGTRTVVELDPIIAIEGNIYMRADAVVGGPNGLLKAPGDSVVLVQLQSGATLKTSSITIPSDEGGRIVFNDVDVDSAAKIKQVGDGRAGSYAYSVVNGESSDDPVVNLATANGGSIIVNGAISNFRGLVEGNSDKDVDIRADITAKTLKFNALNGSFTQGFTWGFTEVDGSPEAIYDALFDSYENYYRTFVRASATGTAVTYSRGTIPLAPRQGEIRAGANVFITADFLNINGLVQAGRGTYDVTLGAGLQSRLDTLANVAGAGRLQLHDPLETGTDLVPRDVNITSNVAVYYNYETDTIELDPMLVQGGTIVLTGQVLSTGSGELQSLDGFGRINVVNETTAPIYLTRTDLGPAGAGIEGLVRITDTSKPLGGGRFLTTEYRRLGNTIQQVDNTTFTTVTDEFGLTREVPTFEVASFGGRSSTYQPVLNRDYVVLRGEKTVTETDFLRNELVVIGIKGSKTTVTNSTTDTRALPIEQLGSGPYLTASLGGDDYGYALTATKLSESTQEDVNYRKTHDSVRWYKLGSGYRHFRWTDIRTTVQLYEHRLKADYPIAVTFGGSDSGSFNVASVGTVIFGDALTNLSGTSTVTSTAGSILTGGTQIVLETGDLSLTALNGRIGSINGAFRIDQTAGAVLTALAGTDINIREMDGDMNVARIATTNRSADFGRNIVGAVKLDAQGGIYAATGASAVQVTGSQIELKAATGGIGALTIDTQDGDLIALAQDNIDLTEVSGDLALRSVESQLGSVALTVETGALLDRNAVETRDLRTEAELSTLYTEQLDLNGSDAADRATQQLDALRAEQVRLYDEYWDRREAGDTDPTFTLDAATRTVLLTGAGNSAAEQANYDAQLDIYVAQRQAYFDQWDADAARDDGFVPVLSAEQTASALDGIEWTVDELTRSLNAGLILGTADTNTRVETPNITAKGDITLRVQTEVGELRDPYVISGGRRLTTEDLLVLSTAERSDLDLTIPGEVTIRQAEDLNFAMGSEGKLTIFAGQENIFLGSDGAADVARIQGTKDIRLKVDGDLTNAGTNPVAITGSLMILESGNNGSIGTAANPLTLEVLAGGNAVLRGGTGVYVSAPVGDLPLGEVFSNARAVLSAQGAITDFVGSGVSRIRAASISLDGGSIGTSAVKLPVWVEGIDGTIEVTTRVGDVNLISGRDAGNGVTALRFGKLDIAQGGEIEAEGEATLLVAANFGGTSTLRFTLAEGLGVDPSLGTATVLTGGTAIFTSRGPVPAGTGVLRTSLSGVSFAGTGATAFTLANDRDLVVGSITQNDADSTVTLTVAGALDAGTIAVPGLVLATAESVTQGRVSAGRLVIDSTGDVGALAALDLTVGNLNLKTDDGNADLILRDRATEIERIVLGGINSLMLDATGSAVTLAAGEGITSQGGALTFALSSLNANADIRSNGGAIGIDATGVVTQSAGTEINAGAGTIRAGLDDDAVLSGLVTTNASANALGLTVGGTLSVAAGELDDVLVANAAGAVTTLRLNRAAPIGPNGLRVNLDTLDAETALGDLHVLERDDLILRSATMADGALDLHTLADLTVQTVAATRQVTLTAGGSLRGEGAAIGGTDIRLFAFGGDLTGVTGNRFTADTSDGSILHLLALDDLRYVETAGDLVASFALAERGDLELEAAGSLTLGLLGAGGTLRLSANGDLTVNRIGHARVDIADEVALQLVRPELMGIKLASSPMLASLTANGAGATLRGGLLSVKDRLELRAETVLVTLRDDTTEDGLDLVVTDATGAMTGLVQVDQVDGGIAPLLTDTFAPVTDLDRDLDYTGETRLVESLIGNGEVTVQGTALLAGPDLRIGGDVWLRQREFDVLATITYVDLNLEADAQLLDLNQTGFQADLREGLDLTVNNILVLNRRTGGVGVNGGQGFGFLVGTETAILGLSFRQGTGVNSTRRFGGILETGVVRLPVQVDEDQEEEQYVPMIQAALR